MQTDMDLVLFAGQSNMAGRGSSKDAPAVEEGGGYEFRAISDPTVLHPIAEPFGVNENKPGGINEEGMKTGSLVSALVKAYHERTGRIIVGVSASKGERRSVSGKRMAYYYPTPWSASGQPKPG